MTDIVFEFDENPLVISKSRINSQRLAIYISAISLTIIAIVLGYFFSFELTDKVFFFGPVFLIIILILFYGLLIKPKHFSPMKIQRYTIKPRPVEEVFRLLKISNTTLAAERMYRVVRTIICKKVSKRSELSDDDIIAAVIEKYALLELNVRETFKTYRDLVNDQMKIPNEKEFLDHYNNLMTLVNSMDEPTWRGE